RHATRRWWAMSQTRTTAWPIRRKTPSPEVAGVVVTVEPSYPRDVGIGWHILLPILVAAGGARFLRVVICPHPPGTQTERRWSAIAEGTAARAGVPGDRVHGTEGRRHNRGVGNPWPSRQVGVDPSRPHPRPGPPATAP